MAWAKDQASIAEAYTDDIIALLNDTGLGAYADSFVEEEVYGEMFLSFEVDDLSELGVENELDMQRLLRVLQILKGEVPTVIGMLVQ